MKLEFLFDLTDGGKYPQADPVNLIRLFDFNHDEAMCLSTLVLGLIENPGKMLRVDELPFVQRVNCRLVFQVGPKDEGIDLSSDRKTFVCRLRQETYLQMVEYMKSFVESDVSGYHWLYDPAEGKVDLLMSADGSW